MVHFASEVVDMFLSYLPHSCASASDPAAEVKKALKSCSLVCRSWRPLAAARLFRELTIFFSYSTSSINRVMPYNRCDNPDRWGHWWPYEDRRQNIKTSAACEITSLNEFLEFLSTNEHICRHIRRLFLRGFGPRKAERHVRPELLTAVVDMLPRLMCLELFNVGVNSPGHRVSVHTWPVVGRALPQLTVKYERDDFKRGPSDAHNASDVFRLLACFGNVETLNIEPPTRSVAKMTSLHALAKHLRIRHLSMNTTGIDSLHSRALSQFLFCMTENRDILAGMRSLSLEDRHSGCKNDREPDMFSALTAACATLESYTAKVLDAGCISHPNLSACVALQSCTLTLSSYDTAEDVCKMLDTVAADLQALGLARATHPAFRDLTLVLRASTWTFVANDEYLQAQAPTAAICARWPTQRCAKLLLCNRLDAALVRLAEDLQLEKIDIRCEVRSKIEIGSESIATLLRCMFPKMERARLAKFDTVWMCT